MTGNVFLSVIANKVGIYTFGGYRFAGSHAIRAGGKHDVTDSHMVWSNRESSYVATPLFHDDHLYWIDDRG
ncbi:hypothetical protein [Planctomycetes bacterium CA13]|uniref:hypothetical protein n=1 Tax=Novipirellula herctigrandis TaxID=2527986 RepID=UPI0011B675DD